MADAFTSSYVNHVGRANRDYVCTWSNKSTFVLPKDTKIVIVDMDMSRDKFVIWWEDKNLYTCLGIQAARSLIIALPERRWITGHTQDRRLQVMTDVQTVDKYNKSITYSVEHHGYVRRMSTDGMFFLVNILHGPDIGRKGVRIHVKYGLLTDDRTSEMTYWMHRRLEFLKDYTCVDSDGEEVHTFKEGDRSCVVRGIGAGTTVLRVTSPQMGASHYPLRVDISAHAVRPDAVYYKEDRLPDSYYTESDLFRDGWWIRADRSTLEDAVKPSSDDGMDYCPDIIAEGWPGYGQ